MSWFTVDKGGLAAILERRGKFFALAELLGNSWDSMATEVVVKLEPIPEQPYVRVTVEDDGEGFADLDEAFTMFARSRRGGDAEKRGRFNLGEKLVLSLCRKAKIVSTGGALIFDDAGKRRSKEAKSRGTLFVGEVRMTRDELGEVYQLLHEVIPPVLTYVNGKEMARPAPLCVFETKLPTEIADEDGSLRRTVRLAKVEVYDGDLLEGGILEMGIPVVETKNGYRLNVLQKVPLGMERDNVTPAFLKALQAALLNHVHQRLTPEVAAQPWVQDAAGDARALPAAVKSVIAKRFGERAVSATVGDVCANAHAEAAGFTVVPGGALSAEVWANVRKCEALIPSARAFPTPKPAELAQQAENRPLCPACQRPL